MEPRRLLEEDDDRFELRLLRSARRDEAPPGAVSRAAVALGFGASATAVASSAHGAPAVAKTTAAALAKWFGVGMVSGLAVTGSVCLVTVPATHANRPAPVVSVPVQSVRAVGVAVRARAAEETAELAPMPDLPSGSPREDTNPRRVAPMVRRTGAAPTAPTETAREPVPVVPDPAPPQNATLSEELSILERARRALVQRDPAGVLRELDVYSSSPRTGVLDAEARMLRIEALVQQGDRARAVELAKAFLVANPSSPHAARLEKVIDGSPN